MAVTVNHLKYLDAQRKTLTVAFGLHKAAGHLLWSRVEGTSPSHQIYAFNRLGEGKWNAVKGVWFKGFNLAATEYNFHQGGHATSMAEVDPWFPLDVPHSHTATLSYRAPVGVGDPDNVNNPPGGLTVMAETKLCPDFNSAGVQTDFSYTANPAREIAELLTTYARLPNLPSIYASAAEYWLSRIDWANWTEFRDYHNTLETVDYTTIPDFEGFGLTASYFSDQTLTTLYAKRVEPVFDIQLGAGSPAVGLSATNFSARFEGKIKPKYTENYTFYLTHDGGAKLWVNDVLIIDEWATTGEHSGTANLTADQFTSIKIEFKNSAATPATSHLTLEWTSTSQTRQVVPSKYLYPKSEQRPRYESHVYFDSPTGVSDAINRILFLTNSVKQDVNGKLRFFCLEQLAPEFEFNSSNIIEGTFNFRRRDILQSDPITEYEARMLDLDSQYLEEPVTPVSYKTDWLTRKTRENVRVIDLYNMTRWQARKILQTQAKLDVGNNLIVEFNGIGAKTYPAVPGALIPIDHRKIGETRNFLIREATDSGVKESARTQSGEIEKRTFRVQEWS